MKRAHRDSTNKIFHLVMGSGPYPGPDHTMFFLIVAQSAEEAVSKLKDSNEEYRVGWVVLRCEIVRFPGFVLTVEPEGAKGIMELK